jgi:hypothetical protein
MANETLCELLFQYVPFHPVIAITEGFWPIIHVR